MSAPAIRFGTQRTLPFPAARVWALLGDFARLPGWFPGIDGFSAQGSVPGCERTILIGNFPPVRHRLLVQDDAGRRTRYQVVDGPGLAEADGFVVEIAVSAAGPGACHVDWQAEILRRPALVPPGGEAAFAARTQGSYERALDHAAARLAAGAT